MVDSTEAVSREVAAEFTVVEAVVSTAEEVPVLPAVGKKFSGPAGKIE